MAWRGQPIPLLAHRLTIGWLLEHDGFVFGVAPNDPLTTVAAVAGILATAFFAALVPARRATMVDPMAVLREE